jgi:hypothetical protein
MFKYKRILVFSASVGMGAHLEDVNDAYAYKLQKYLGNIELVINAASGRSNLEILSEILKHKDYKDGDLVLPGWSMASRDVIFDGKGNVEERIGPFEKMENSALLDHWAYVHTEADMTIRTWYYAHHAEMYLKTKGVATCHMSFDGHTDLYKPDYLNVDILFFGGRIDRAKDGIHPGKESHRVMYKKIKTALCLK